MDILSIFRIGSVEVRPVQCTLKEERGGVQVRAGP